MRGNRIRLLKFLNILAIGGTERQFVNIIHNLNRNSFDVHMACFKRIGEFLQEVEATGLPLTDYSISKLFSARTLKEQLRFAEYLRRNRIQVVHSYGFYPNVFAIPAAKLAGVPVIIAAIRDTGAHLSPMQLRLHRFVSKFADCVLVNADAIRHWLIEQGHSAERIRVIRNGTVVRPASRPAGYSGIRREFNLPEDSLLVANVCRLQPVKGLRYYIEAAAKIASRHENARFLIVGDGTEKEPMLALAKKLGIADRIVITGFRTDIPSILSDISISVSSSTTEGLSNTLLEASAAGIPVIATGVGGNPEIVVHGRTGLLVPPRDSDALAVAISHLLENRDLSRWMGNAGRQRIADHFSVERMVRQTEALYAELTGHLERGAA